MKLLLTFFTFALVINFTDAQTDYQNELVNTLKELKEANGTDNLQQIANKFERIAEMANDDWLPAFHTSYAYVVANFSQESTDDKEAMLDNAQSWLNKAKTNLNTGNDTSMSEIHALQSFIYLARVAVKPMIRGMSYGSKIQEEYDAALTLNAINPRPDYVMGQYYQGMPEMFGGGKEAACKYFQRSASLFKKFEPNGDLAPNWGRADVEEIIEACE